MEELSKDQQIELLTAFHREASEFISGQQKKIEELTKHLMVLETRNKLLESEIEQYKVINKQYKEKEEREKFKRGSIREMTSTKPREEPKPEVVEPQYITTKGFESKRKKEIL